MGLRVRGGCRADSVHGLFVCRFPSSALCLGAPTARSRTEVDWPLPKPSKFHSETPDVVLDLALVPAIGTTGRAFSWLRWIQLGSIHAYLLYILLTLLVLMLWR